MSFSTPAERLLRDLGVTAPSEIDLDAIAWHCGARIASQPLDGCEAQIIGYGDRAVIIVNSRSHPKRRRFSIAHELGHWHHHRGRSSFCRSTDIENYCDPAFAHERVADMYAADLLLPAYLFEPRAAGLGKVTIDAACSLANEFDTSFTAAAMRLVDMGPELSIILCHGPHGRKWFKRGRGVPDSWYPQQELDARSGAMEVVFGNQARSNRKLVNGAFWFGGRTARSIEVFEQTLRLSSCEALTLLVFKDKSLSGD